MVTAAASVGAGAPHSRARRGRAAHGAGARDLAFARGLATRRRSDPARSHPRSAAQRAGVANVVTRAGGPARWWPRRAGTHARGSRRAQWQRFAAHCRLWSCCHQHPPRCQHHMFPVVSKSAPVTRANGQPPAPVPPPVARLAASARTTTDHGGRAARRAGFATLVETHRCDPYFAVIAISCVTGCCGRRRRR